MTAPPSARQRRVSPERAARRHPSRTPSGAPGKSVGGLVQQLSVGRKLLLLTTLCLLPSFAVGFVGYSSTNRLAEDTRLIDEMRIRVGRALPPRQPQQRGQGRRVPSPGRWSRHGGSRDRQRDDVASAREVLATLDALELPADVRASLDDLGPAADQYYTFVETFVADAHRR